MQTVLAKDQDEMGRKKGERKTVMLRVYEEFAEKVKQSSGERRLTAAEFCEAFLSACADKAHAAYIQSETKKLAKGDKS